MTQEEQQAIRRVRAGDPDAFRLLMDSHLAAVLRVSLHITGNEVDAEEVAQEAFLHAFHKLASFREQSTFGTWVYRIAVNCALNHVKRRQRDIPWNAQPLELDGSGDEQFPSAAASPDSALLQEADLRAQDQLLSILTPMERTAFVLRHLEDQSLEDIAAALRISVNSTKQAIFRAVTKLRRHLTPARPASRAITSTPLPKESQ